jgi:diguanylate cyclase (GGDEF)-like protein
MAVATETSLTEREAAVLVREQEADRREAAAISTAEYHEQIASQLREANEHLVVAAVRSQTMTEVAEHATVQMALKAERDFLTGLPNRALLTDRLTQSIALSRRLGKRVALMYLDLDHFKNINDSFGHPVGDLLLQSAAKRLLACVRNSDTVSRQGGDEFVVLLNGIETVHDAALTAAKLIRVMAQPHMIGDHRLQVTLSIGLSVYPDDGNDVEAILKNADTAMYQAKKGGRNNYQRFALEINAA